MNIYKEKRTILGNSRKNWNDLNSALSTLKPKLITRKEFLIILDTSGSLVDWHV